MPPADVFEQTEGITLQLDMPGVDKDRLNLQANRDTLLIEGTARLDMPEGMTALYADVRSTIYRRSFVLSDELESDKTEASRNVAPPIVDDLRGGRLCRLAVAAELAGLETPVDAALDVYETLAYADASVSWIAWNNSLPCFLSRYLSAATREEVFADPRWLYACSTRPTGRAAVAADGYRVSGRWGIVSGCELAEWILLLCVVEENGSPRMVAPGTPELRFAFLRRAK